MKRIAFLLPVLLLISAGCKAQLPTPTSYVVNLTWVAPVPASGSTWVGCVSASPCSYVVSRCAGSAATCVTSNSAAWTQLNQASPAIGTSYTDSTAAGLTAYYVVNTVQTGANPGTSGPSNETTAQVVPASPLAPTLGAPTLTASLVKPALPTQTAPQMAALHLTATLIARR
jgi:hypothetical protein